MTDNERAAVIALLTSIEQSLRGIEASLTAIADMVREAQAGD